MTDRIENDLPTARDYDLDAPTLAALNGEYETWAGQHLALAARFSRKRPATPGQPLTRNAMKSAAAAKAKEVAGMQPTRAAGSLVGPVAFFILFGNLVDYHTAVLTWRELRVYLVCLRWRDNETGVTYVSVATIAAATGMSRRAVQRALKSLAAKGYLPVQQRGGGPRRSSVRLVTLPEDNSGHDSRCSDSESIAATAPTVAAVNESPGGAQQRPRRRATAATVARNSGYCDTQQRPRQPHNLQRSENICNVSARDLPLPSPSAGLKGNNNKPLTSSAAPPARKVKRPHFQTIAQLVAFHRLDDQDESDARWLTGLRNGKGEPVTLSAIDALHTLKRKPLHPHRVVAALREKHEADAPGITDFVRFAAAACRDPITFLKRQRKYDRERAGDESNDDALEPGYRRALGKMKRPPPPPPELPNGMDVGPGAWDGIAIDDASYSEG